jgi:hypothetical protein
MTDELTQNTVRSLRHDRARQIVFRWQRCTLVAPSDRPMSTALRMSRSLELRDDGLILLHLLVLVAPQKVMGSYFAWESGERSAPVGSVEAEKMLEDAVSELSDALREAVEVFVLPAAGVTANAPTVTKFPAMVTDRVTRTRETPAERLSPGAFPLVAGQDLNRVVPRKRPGRPMTATRTGALISVNQARTGPSGQDRPGGNADRGRRRGPPTRHGSRAAAALQSPPRRPVP